MLKKLTKMEKNHRILFSVLIAFAVVSFWRGVWGMMDEYLFPGNYRLSLWISLVLGFVILVATNYATKELM
jgi:hypothetical protein